MASAPTTEVLINEYFDTKINRARVGRVMGFFSRSKAYSAPGGFIKVATQQKNIDFKQEAVGSTTGFAADDIQIRKDDYVTITKHHIVSKRQSVINTVAAAVPYDQLLATTDILFREYQARTLQYKLANIVGNVQQKAANTNQSDIGFVGTGKSVTQTINTAVATANRDGKGISIADLTRIRATFEQQGFDSKMDGFCLAVPPHIYSSLLSEPNFVRADSVGSARGIIEGEIGFLYGIKIIATRNTPYAVKDGLKWTAKTNVAEPLGATHDPISVAFVETAVGHSLFSPKLEIQVVDTAVQGSSLYVWGHEGAGRIFPGGEGVILVAQR